jgi:hypothetical protein
MGGATQFSKALFRAICQHGKRIASGQGGNGQARLLCFCYPVRPMADPAEKMTQITLRGLTKTFLAMAARKRRGVR